MIALLLPLPEAAQRLGISKSTLEREIRDGAIATCRLRGRVLIAESDIRAYISRRRTYTPSREIPCQQKNVVIFGTPASKLKVGALRSLLDGEQRARTRFK